MDGKTTMKIDHDLNERIAKLLFRCRDSFDISRKDLALMVGTTAAIVGKIENGNRKLKVTELLIICSALSIDPNKFLRVALGDFELIPSQLKLFENEMMSGLRQACYIGASFKDSHNKLRGTLAKILDDKRRQSGISMRSGSKKIGVAHSFFAKLNNGRGVSFAELVFLCQLYNTNSLLVIKAFVGQINGSDKFHS